MTRRIFTPLALASFALTGLLAAGSAQAVSFSPASLCELYGLDLKHDLMLVTASAPNYGTASASLSDAKLMCGSGEATAGVELMKTAIGTLGLPVRVH